MKLPEVLPAPLFPIAPLGYDWPWRNEPASRTGSRADGPKISVVIPSFNQGRFLEAALRSVLLQGYSQTEVIVIDGGSTDESVEVIRHYESWLYYWISERDAGQADAVNKGLAVATGELLTFLNSDDLQTPSALERVATAALSHPEVILFHGHRILVDVNQGVLGWSFAPPFDPLRHGYTIASETAYWRRNAPGAAAGFDPQLRFALDLDFFCRLHQQGKFLLLPDYLGYFRCHADAKSVLLQDVCRDETETLWAKHFKQKPLVQTVAPGRCRMLWNALKNPRLILSPYLQGRFGR